MSDLPAPLVFHGPNPIDPADAGDKVDTLFGDWGTAGDPFKPYIIFNAMQVDALSIVAGPAERSGGQPITFLPFPGSTNGIRFQYISALLSSPDSNPVFSPNPANAVFVLTEMFSAPLTYAATQIVSNAMMAGLATRLILDSYNAAWGSNINLDLGVTGFGLKTAITKLSTDLMNPKSWHEKGTFAEIHRSLTDSASTQAAGIVLGWIAADSILQIADNKKRTDCLRSIWRLIGSKYSTRDLGAIVSFTLNYLIGFIRNRRTIDIINGGTKIPSQRDLGIILQELTAQVLQDPRDNELIALTQNFHRMLVDEFYAIARKDVSSTFPAGDRQTALEQYRGFLVGFQRGTMVAAELLFKETFSSAFDIGYAMGFRDGYAQGYAAGWQAGYDTGYAEGKAVGLGLSNALTQVSDTLTNVDGFVNDLTKAGTVIVGIASLF
jgi:hypothetical protein